MSGFRKVVYAAPGPTRHPHAPSSIDRLYCALHNYHVFSPVSACYSRKIYIWESLKRPFVSLGVLRASSDSALIAARRRLKRTEKSFMASTAHVKLVRPEDRRRDRKHMCLDVCALPVRHSRQYWTAFGRPSPILHCQSCILGWVGWWNQPRHGPFGTFWGETLRGFGVLMLRMLCVGERDAVDGTLGECQFGRG